MNLNDNVPKLFDIIAENTIVSIFLFPIIIIFYFFRLIEKIIMIYSYS